MPLVTHGHNELRPRYGLSYRQAQWARTGLTLVAIVLVSAFVLAASVPLSGFLRANGMTMTAPGVASHRIVFQVSVNDPAIMLHVIGSVENALKNYRERHESVAVEIVANGAGLHMFRADTSPVSDAMRDIATFPEVTLSACGNSKSLMEEREGHSITMLDRVRIVPAGIVRLVELQEQGWSYIRP